MENHSKLTLMSTWLMQKSFSAVKTALGSFSWTSTPSTPSSQVLIVRPVLCKPTTHRPQLPWYPVLMKQQPLTTKSHATTSLMPNSPDIWLKTKYAWPGNHRLQAAQLQTTPLSSLRYMDSLKAMSAIKIVSFLEYLAWMLTRLTENSDLLLNS